MVLQRKMDHLSSKSHMRRVSTESNSGLQSHTKQPPAAVNVGHVSRRKEPVQHPKPPLTPNTSVPATMPQPMTNPLLPSAPASPPTPAPSPTPHHRVPMWQVFTDNDEEDPILRDARLLFGGLSTAGKETWLASIVDACDIQSLSFLHSLVSPRLKKDPFRVLPNELCFKV